MNSHRGKKSTEVLLYVKASSYERYLLKAKTKNVVSKKSSVWRRFLATHKRHYASLAAIERVLRDSGVTYAKHRRGRRVDFSRFNRVICVGGDGTFLEAARQVTDQEILGVNSDPSWSVGRFCFADAGTFPALFERWIQGKASCIRLSRLRVKLTTVKEEVNVLNDILISHRNPAAMSHYEMRVRHCREEQRSSGVWVASAAGSSGAVHSAGGRILPLKSRRWQFAVREPYQGHGVRYRLKRGLLSAEEKLKVVSLMSEGAVFYDGPHHVSPFPFGDTLTVSRSSQSLKVVTG